MSVYMAYSDTKSTSVGAARRVLLARPTPANTPTRQSCWRTDGRTFSQLLSDWTSQRSCTLRQMLWHRWKKYPFTTTWVSSDVFTALMTADSKSLKTVVDLCWRRCCQ